MKRTHVLAGLGILLLLLAVSCSLPQGPAGSAVATIQPQKLAVETDASRRQGVYVNEKGERFDIVSQEGSEGASIRCVEALQILEVAQQAVAKSFSTHQHQALKALVLGRRHDDWPGVWLIFGDDTIHPVEDNEDGGKSSKLAETKEIDWLIHGVFGWVYKAELLLGPDSEDGYIILGYAKNRIGFDLGRWKIEPNTTVAVYWRLAPNSHGYYRLSRARIIGQPSADYAERWRETDNDFPNKPYRHHLYRFLHSLFASFRLFFLDWFDLYLTGFTSAKYEGQKQVYLVTGPVAGPAVKLKDQTGTATITLDGVITIALEQQPGNGHPYKRIVIETYPYSGGAAATDTTLRLYDASGKELAYNENVVSTDPIYPSARIDHTTGLNPGTYYIRINSDTENFGPYVVRILSLTSGKALPPYEYPGGAATEAWPDGDDAAVGNVPATPRDISLGSANWLNRELNTEPDHLNVVLPHDVDWLRLVLP
jgi:hypothetical protein